MPEETVKCPVDAEVMAEEDCAGCNFFDKCWTAERTLIVKMKGRLKEINNYCAEVGELANKYDIEVEFQ